MASKSFKVSFTLDESDAAYFRGLYRTAKQHSSPGDRPKILKEVGGLIGRVRDAKKAQTFVLEAITVLRAGLEAHPRHIASQVLLGRCLVELEQWPEARDLLEGVTKRDPTHLVANKLLVETYLATGLKTEARDRLDLYTLLNDSDPDIEALDQRLSSVAEELPVPETTPSEVVESKGDTPVASEVVEPATEEEEIPVASEVDSPAPSEVVEPATSEVEIPVASDTVDLEPSVTAFTRDESETTLGGSPGGSAPEPFGDLWGDPEQGRLADDLEGGDVFGLTSPAETVEKPSTQSMVPETAVGGEAGTDGEAGIDGEDTPAATVTLGNLYLQQGHRDDAAAIFAELLNGNADNVAARVGLAAATSKTEWPLTALDLVAREVLDRAAVGERKAALLRGYLARLKTPALPGDG